MASAMGCSKQQHLIVCRNSSKVPCPAPSHPPVYSVRQCRKQCLSCFRLPHKVDVAHKQVCRDPAKVTGPVQRRAIVKAKARRLRGPSARARELDLGREHLWAQGEHSEKVIHVDFSHG